MKKQKSSIKKLLAESLTHNSIELKKEESFTTKKKKNQCNPA